MQFYKPNVIPTQLTRGSIFITLLGLRRTLWVEQYPKRSVHVLSIYRNRKKKQNTHFSRISGARTTQGLQSSPQHCPCVSLAISLPQKLHGAQLHSHTQQLLQSQLKPKLANTAALQTRRKHEPTVSSSPHCESILLWTCSISGPGKQGRPSGATARK